MTWHEIPIKRVENLARKGVANQHPCSRVLNLKIDELIYCRRWLAICVRCVYVCVCVIFDQFSFCSQQPASVRCAGCAVGQSTIAIFFEQWTFLITNTASSVAHAGNNFSRPVSLKIPNSTVGSITTGKEAIKKKRKTKQKRAAP